jgi:hypothetical protein
MPDALSSHSHGSDSDSSEAPRVLRKRKREDDVSSRKKIIKPAKVKLSKEEMQLQKLSTKIEAKKEAIRVSELQIEDVTSDLRETDCQRTRCLGKDRFCNRYWWYERNGMPYSGVPDGSTSHHGYANARLWVQGPYKDDLDGMFDLTKEEEAAYKQTFGISIKDRREKEEGATRLVNADYYGYLETPDQLDQLIGWLDDRGKREKVLKKELTLWRDVIVEYFDKMSQYVSSEEARFKETEDTDKPPTRISTRTKTYVDVDSSKWNCLKWSNSAAVTQLGLKHGDGPKKKMGRRGVAVKKAVEKVAEKEKKTEKETGRKAQKEKIQLDRRGRATKKGK